MVKTVTQSGCLVPYKVTLNGEKVNLTFNVPANCYLFSDLGAEYGVYLRKFIGQALNTLIKQQAG